MESEIIFLINKEMAIPENMNFRYYMVQKPITHSHWGELRDWFDYADDFLEYCKSNFDNDILLKNIVFDSKKVNIRASVVDSRYQLLLKMIDYDFNNLPSNYDLIVYGAGNIGKYFYKQVKDKCSIKYFVDLKTAGGYRQYSNNMAM